MSAQSTSSAPSTSAVPAAQTPEALQAELRSRLIESGEYEKLLGVLKTRLDEAGWEDNLRGLAREKARAQDPPDLQGLVGEVEPKALESIPSEAREEILGMIANFVKKNVE